MMKCLFTVILIKRYSTLLPLAGEIFDITCFNPFDKLIFNINGGLQLQLTSVFFRKGIFCLINCI